MHGGMHTLSPEAGSAYAAVVHDLAPTSDDGELARRIAAAAATAASGFSRRSPKR